MTAYATGSDLVQRYDADFIGDLAQDDREELDRDAIPTHPNVLAALLDASGEIDVALLAGGRYTPSDLTGLSGNTLNHLIRITCAVAMAALIERRPTRASAEMADAYRKTARAHLEALRRGENVFGIASVQAAGTIDLETVTAVELDTLNVLPSRMGRFFPPSQTRVSRAH